MMSSSLTPATIRTTLATVKAHQHQAQMVPTTAIAPDIWRTYQRVMQIYALTRMGAIDQQKATIRVRHQQQCVNLRNEFSQMPPAQLAQELAELDAAIAWQLAQLEAIDPASEAAVQACETEIEAWLSQAQTPTT